LNRIETLTQNLTALYLLGAALSRSRTTIIPLYVKNYLRAAAGVDPDRLPTRSVL
jgi:hypothetical protein